MDVPISEAAARLSELVCRAEAGDDVVLTREGRAAVRLVAAGKSRSASLDALFEALREAARRAHPGPSAARSQDFLYDEHGLPK